MLECFTIKIINIYQKIVSKYVGVIIYPWFWFKKKLTITNFSIEFSKRKKKYQ